MFDPVWRRGPAAAILLATLTSAAAAGAAEPTYAFDVPRQALGPALVALAGQADASIGTAAAAGCAAPARALRGRYTLEGALTRILEGTGCGYRMLDARAALIVRLAPPPAAPPSPAPPPGPANLPELIVVATRRETPADRLAYPVSSVAGRELAEQGVRDAGDLALVTPAMTVTNLGSGRDKILLRGLSDGPLTGRTQSMVGLYLDDARITYNAPDPNLRLVDIARVEVLRGPQGALYGAGSLGGVVRLVTAAPDATGFDAWVAASGSATRGGAPSGVLEAMVNLPLAAGRGAIRGVAYRELQGGYIDDANLHARDVNRTVRQGVRLAADFELTPAWTLNAGLTDQAINSADTQYAVAGLPAYTRANRLREPHDNDFAEAHVALRGRLGGAQVHWTTAVVRHGLNSRYDASAAPPAPAPPGPVAYDDDNRIESLVSEAVATSAPEARAAWLAGAFYAATRQDTALSLTVLDGGAEAPSLREARHDELDEAALFGQVTLPLGRRLDLTLGGRAFIADTRVRSRLAAGSSAPPTDFSGGVRDTGFAPKVVLAYTHAPDLLVYLQAAQGYRSGGVNTTGAPGQAFSAPGGRQPLRYYQGDDLWSLEAGSRLSLLDNRLVIRAAVFQALWRNIQSDQLLPSALPFTANIGDGRNLGVEAEAGYRAGPLELHAQVLVNGPELDRANPAFPARADLGLAGVPGVSLGGSAHYGWALADRLRLELDGRYAYVGRSRLTFDAATSPRMGDYATGRIAATLAAERWRLTAAVDNPADSRGDTFAYGNPFSLRTTPQVTPLRPVTATLTLKVAY